MRDLALATFIFALLPFVLKRPFWGILMLAWLGYMNPHRLCYSFMFSMPIVYIVTIVTLVGMLASKEIKRIVWSRETIVLAMLVAWMGVTTSQAFYFDLAYDQYVKVIKIQILTFMTLMMLTSKERVHLFVWVMVLSLGLYGVKGGIFTIMNGGAYRVQGPAGSFIDGNNELALALAMTIPLMRYLQLQEKRFALRVLLTAMMLLSAIAAIGSQSRGALVAMALMGTIFWVKGRHKVRSAALIAVTVATIGSIMPEQWYERMGTIQTYDQDASAIGRINAWWTAWNVAVRRPLIGGGFVMFQAPTFAEYAPDPDDVHDVHSIYFEMLGEHGFIGFFLFLLLLVLTWLKCSRIVRLAKGHEGLKWASDLAAMVQVSFVGYLSAGAFLGLAYFDYVYHLIAVVVVVYSLVVAARSGAGAERDSSVRSVTPGLSIGRVGGAR